MRGCNQLRAESFVIQPTRRAAVTRRVASEWIRQLTERTSEAVEANAVQSTMIRETEKLSRVVSVSQSSAADSDEHNKCTRAVGDE